MQFKNPELLYALFLLLIPIFIHLFQLRRFQKVAFTNVAFLKKVNIQTRKSSQLKKWLTLLMRLLALACIILAFAQPFTALKTAINTEKETVLYIDNSFSMQAKGARGPMLQRAAQDIFENIETTQNLNWFTNNTSKKNASVQDFKNEILNIAPSNNQLTPQEILLKANQLFSKSETANKRLIIISDFQQTSSFPAISEDIGIDAVHVSPVAATNISIDSVYVASKNAAKTQIKAIVSGQGDLPQSIPVSLYSDAGLIAKSSVDFNNTAQNTITFDIDNPAGFNGRLEINEPNLPFDNTLFFNINTPEKIKVLSINEADADFLQGIFEQPEFEYLQQTIKTVNYNSIPSQNFVILNEVKQIPSSLSAALRSFVSYGGSFLFIPSDQGDLQSYNALLTSLGMSSFTEEIQQEKKVTQIVFDHPLYQDVFEKRVVNFQYPQVNMFYATASAASVALKFEDNKPFIMNRNGVYVATAAFNTENSNFQSSPLIVPTLYNMAKLSLPLPQLYYEVGKENKFSVPVTLVQDEILTLKDSTSSFIPLQQTKANQVDITTTTEPVSAGTYQILNKEQPLQKISYNYNRRESQLTYSNPNDWEGVTVYESVANLFENIAEANNINQLWKWFAIFALLFLLCEMLILKFYKS